VYRGRTAAVVRRVKSQGFMKGYSGLRGEGLEKVVFYHRE
jgi:hypothetical protein